MHAFSPSPAIRCLLFNRACLGLFSVQGAYGMTVLYGIFPPLMFWRARQQAKAAEGRPEAVEKQSLWDKPAGGFALASMAACSFSVLVSQVSPGLMRLPSHTPPVAGCVLRHM